MSKILVFLTTVVLLSGCASGPGSLVGFSKDPMSKLLVVKYPRVGAEPFINAYEWGLIRRMAKSCQAQIAPQLSTPAESVGVDGATYGIAGAIGVGLGALFLPGTIPMRYAAYGGLAGAMSGGAYGAVIWSYANVSAVASCARDFVRRAGLLDIFIYPAYVHARHPEAKTLSSWHAGHARRITIDGGGLNPVPLPQ